MLQGNIGLPLSQVVHLALEAHQGSNLPSSGSNFPKFIALFSSVMELIATAETLQLLVQVGDHANNVILPALKVLRFVLLKPEIVQDILIFLDWREAVEVPLKFLDLRDHLGGNHLDFSELERFSAMMVKWTTVNNELKWYICGSGNAQHLDFSTPPPVRGFSDVDNDSELDSDDSFE
jgi:hypothetical protein